MEEERRQRLPWELLMVEVAVALQQQKLEPAGRKATCD